MMILMKKIAKKVKKTLKVCKIGEFLCDENKKCLNSLKICDKIKDCEDGIDEKYCNFCKFAI